MQSRNMIKGENLQFVLLFYIWRYVCEPRSRFVMLVSFEWMLVRGRLFIREVMEEGNVRSRVEIADTLQENRSSEKSSNLQSSSSITSNSYFY